MLALTRSINESIFIEDCHDIIKIMVTKIHGKKVQLAVDAPPSVKIYREELLPKIYAERTEQTAKSALSPEMRLSQILINDATSGDIQALNLLHQLGLRALNEGRAEFAKTMLSMAYNKATQQKK
jgi:carbon storage regulator CsrA